VDWQDPLYQKIVAHLPAGAKPGDYVTSLEITARKPAQAIPSSRNRQRVTQPMPKLEVFDPAMCCSTGVCGPQFDTALVRFAADVKWLQEQGAEVRRFNLSQNPAAFVENELVKTALAEKGEAALPLLLVGGEVLTSGRYPERDQLTEALGMKSGEGSIFSSVVAELVAIGSAIAANCEPCLKHHYREAQRLGVSKGDMARAVKMAAIVKDAPHQAILRLADKLTGASLINPAAASDRCCGDKAAADKPSGVCGAAKDSPGATDRYD